MPRPEPTNPRREQLRSRERSVHLWLSDAEHELLGEVAREFGVSRSDLLRLMVRNAKFLTLSLPPAARRPGT